MYMYENRLKVKDVQCTIYVYVYDKEKGSFMHCIMFLLFFILHVY